MVAVVFVLGSFVRTARAAETFRLQWSSPPVTPACPSSEKLAREVAAKLGRDPFDDTSSSEIRGSIERQGASWIVRIGEYKNDKQGYTLESDPFDAPDCGDAHELAVHRITVFIQTGRLDAVTSMPTPITPNPTPAPAKEPLAPVVAAVQPIVPAKPEPERVAPTKPLSPVTQVPPPPFNTHMFLGAGTSFGLLPAPTPAISLNAGFGRGRWNVDASLLLLPEAKHATEPVAVGMTGGFVGACVRAYAEPRFALLGCGHVIVSALHIYVTSVTRTKAGTTPTDAGDLPWVGVAASPRLQVVLVKPLTLQIGADLVVPITRHDICVDKGGLDQRCVFGQTSIAVVPLAQIGMTIF